MITIYLQTKIGILNSKYKFDVNAKLFYRHSRKKKNFRKVIYFSRVY